MGNPIPNVKQANNNKIFDNDWLIAETKSQLNQCKRPKQTQTKAIIK